MTTKEAFPVGTRVILWADHPWSGHIGTVVRFQAFPGLGGAGERPVVKLDNGRLTTVFKPQHIGRVKR